MFNRIIWQTGQLSSLTFFSRPLSYHFLLLSDTCSHFCIETQITCWLNSLFELILLRSPLKWPIKTESQLMDWGLYGLIVLYFMQSFEQRTDCWYTVICFLYNVQPPLVKRFYMIVAHWSLDYYLLPDQFGWWHSDGCARTRSFAVINFPPQECKC